MKLLEFNNQQFHVRSAIVDGEPVFIAQDVCRALEIRNNRDALRRLQPDECGVVSTDTTSTAKRARKSQTMQCVTEAGLYALILSSRKSEAKAFQRWVTHDVLPAIRKRGFYVDPESTAFGSKREGLLFARQMQRLAEAQRAAAQPAPEGFGTIGQILRGLGMSLPAQPAQRLELFRACRRIATENGKTPIRRWTVSAGGVRTLYSRETVQAALANLGKANTQPELF